MARLNERECGYEENFDNRFVYNFSMNASFTGQSRKTSWLYKVAKKGYIWGVDKNNSEMLIAFGNQIDSMITLLKKEHGENWDIHLIPKGRRSITSDERYYTILKYYVIRVVILYPEITISNDDGLSRVIKELYVCFNIENLALNENQYVFTPREITGTRTNVVYEEWFSGYMHSHLPSCRATEFQDALVLSNFCLGTDTPIQDITESLCTEYNEESFQMFLLILNSIVEWESLEGVPHIKMRSVVIGNDGNVVSLRISGMRDYHDSINNVISTLDVDFVYADNRYKIKNNEKLEELYRDIILQNYRQSRRRLLVKELRGEYYGYSYPTIKSKEELIRMLENDSGESPYFFFRSKKVKFKIKPFNGELPSIEEYKVHPKLLNYATEQLEQELFVKSIERSIAERQVEIGNARRYFDENQVSM